MKGWYNANMAGKEAITKELLEACKESLPWFGKLAADHDGDHIAEAVMRHYARIEAVIKKAEGEQP